MRAFTKWDVSTHPKNILPKGTSFDDGTILEQDQREDSKKKAVYEHRLTYDGCVCHCLTGEHGLSALKQMAKELNEKRYEPSFEKGRPFLSLSQAERLKIAFNSHPALDL